MAGLVFSGETRIAKPGQQLGPDAALEVRGRDHPWVGRGGVKLAHALDFFALDPAGAGSNGHRLLHRRLHPGAARARRGACVRGGCRHQPARLAPASGPADHGTRTDQCARAHNRADRSALRLGGVRCELYRPCQGARSAARARCPGRHAGGAGQAAVRGSRAARVGKGGIVRDPALHERVCAEVLGWLEGCGWGVLGLTPSPITGTEGNVEFLVAARPRMSRLSTAHRPGLRCLDLPLGRRRNRLGTSATRR